MARDRVGRVRTESLASAAFAAEQVSERMRMEPIATIGSEANGAGLITTSNVAVPALAAASPAAATPPAATPPALAPANPADYTRRD